MRRFLFLFSLLFASLGPPAFAQGKAGPFTINASSSPCAAIGVTNNSTVGITVTGTFSATLQPEVAMIGRDGSTAGTPQNTQVTPSTSTTPQATITAAGVYKAAVGGFDTFLVCVTSFVSGSATIYLNVTGAVNAGLFGGGTVTHTAGSLTSGLPVIGNGAGDITVGTKSGNTTEFATVTGSLSTGNCAKFDASGNFVDAGIVCSPPGATTFELPVAVNALNIYGDSISIGFGLNPTTQAWPYALARGSNLPILNNFAVSGQTASQEAASSETVTMSMATASAGLYGANDLPFSGISQGQFIGGLQALLVNTGLLPANKACAASTAQCTGTITFTGSWTSFNPTNPLGINGKFSSTANDTAAATVSGTTVYVAYWCSNGFTLTYDVLIDTVSQGPFTETCPSTLIVSRRFAGLASSSHAVTVKVTTGGAGNDATVLWIAGNSGTSFPTTIAGNTIPRPANETIAHVVSQNAAIATLIANLQADGLQVIAVNDYAVMSSATSTGSVFYQGDNVHPNPIGAALIGGLFLNTIFQQPTTSPTLPGIIAPSATPSTYSTTYTNATTTFSNVPNLAFDVAALTGIHVTCSIVWQNNTSNDGIKYQWTFTQGGSTNILASMVSTGTSGTSGGTFENKTVTAFSTPMANDLATITNNTNFLDNLTINFTSGGIAGTLQLQAAANVGGTITIATGSSCSRQ